MRVRTARAGTGPRSADYCKARCTASAATSQEFEQHLIKGTVTNLAVRRTRWDFPDVTEKWKRDASSVCTFFLHPTNYGIAETKICTEMLYGQLQEW